MTDMQMRDIDIQLFRAVYNDIDQVQLIINSGANVNAIANGNNLNYSETPLIVATNMNNKNIIELLIEQGADPSKCDCVGNNPLNHACESGNYDLVCYFIGKGLPVNPEGEGVNPPLTSACRCRDEKKSLQLAKYLLENGADIHAKNRWCCSAIFEAAASANKQVVELLLGNGANPDEYNPNGHYTTPLLVAIDKDPNKDIIGIIQLLMKHGAKLGWCYRKAKSLAVNNPRVFAYLESITNLTTSPDDPVAQGDYEFQLAMYYAGNNRYDELEEACNNFIKQTEKENIPIYFRKEDISESLIEHSRAQCFYILALSYFKRNKYDRTIEILNDGLKTSDKETLMQIHYLLAECSMQKVANLKGKSGFDTATALSLSENALHHFNESKRIGYCLDVGVNEDIRKIIDDRVDATERVVKMFKVSNSPATKLIRFGVLFIIILSLFKLGSCMFNDKGSQKNQVSYYTSSESNLRSSPAKGKNVITAVPKGSHVTVLENNGEWLKVRFNNTVGYLKSNLVSTSRP